MTSEISVDSSAVPSGFPGASVDLGIVEIYGEAAVGKTTVALLLAAQFQSRGARVAWVDADACMNWGRATACGLRLAEEDLDRPSMLSEAFLTLHKRIVSGRYEVVVLDDLSSLLPEGWLGGLQPERLRVWIYTKIKETLELALRYRVCVVLVRRTRVPPGKRGDYSRSSDNTAIRHCASVRLEVSARDRVCRVRTTKNRYGPHVSWSFRL